MGDGPERGNTRIKRLLREEAMMDTEVALYSCYCSEAWLCQYNCGTRIHFRVWKKSMRYRETGILAVHLAFSISHTGCSLRRSRNLAAGSSCESVVERKSKPMRYPRNVHESLQIHIRRA